jgi:hypothetical protein
MGLNPTAKAVIGTFVNGRNSTDDFLQVASSQGGTIFGWIDANGVLQGTLASSATGIGGAIASGQVAIGTAPNVIGGTNNLTYNSGTATLSAGTFSGTTFSGTTFNGTTFNGTTFSGATLNATTGFQLSGGAPNGQFLRGNGTNFVPSNIQSGDVLWSQLGNATSSLILANGTNATTFNQTNSAVWTWANITPATSGVPGQNSPAINLSGTAWNGSASVVDAWQITNVTGFDSVAVAPTSSLNFSHPSGAGPSRTSITLSGSVGSFFGQSTSFALGAVTVQSFSLPAGPTQGASISVTAASNASGGLTTYVWSTTVGFVPSVNMYVTIAGFVNAGNNGRFQVQSASTSSLVLYNGGGVLETRAATAVLDIAYSLDSGTVAMFGPGSGSFSITGTGYGVNQNIIAWPNTVALAITTLGDTTDATWFRNINTVPINNNHGFELGAVIDGTGVAPIVVRMGVFSGFTGILFPQLVSATGGANQNSNPVVVQSNYWTGAAAALNSWSIQDVLGTGANPTSTLTIQQSGSSGLTTVAITPNLTVQGFSVGKVICSGQIALSTGAIASGTRAINTLSCAGLSTSTDAIDCTFSGDTNAVTGYAPSASGGLTLKTWISAGTINVDQINNTGGSITPGAATLNCKGLR